MRVSLPVSFFLIFFSFSLFFNISFSQISYEETLQIVKEQIHYLYNGNVWVETLSRDNNGNYLAKLCSIEECIWATLHEISNEYTSTRNSRQDLDFTCTQLTTEGNRLSDYSGYVYLNQVTDLRTKAINLGCPQEYIDALNIYINLIEVNGITDSIPDNLGGRCAIELCE